MVVSGDTGEARCGPEGSATGWPGEICCGVAWGERSRGGLRESATGWLKGIGHGVASYEGSPCPNLLQLHGNCSCIAHIPVCMPESCEAPHNYFETSSYCLIINNDYLGEIIHLC